MSNPDYNFEKVNRASLARGPLVKWAIAQLSYADMLMRVDPLRNELIALEEAAKEKQQEAEQMTALIARLEKSISSYKEEYAQLISQAEAIKNDLKQVQDKVDRSMSLLKSLGIEKDRWQETSENFKFQMTTIIGDVFLSSAFLAYGGYFDQLMRHTLFSNWCEHLKAAHIQFRTDLARTEFLSDPDQRIQWQSNRLPTDDLCTENAIMLSRFNRYPLIIDPSGQATEFIMNEYAGKKITKTSFLDDSFRKNLESALRFGNPLLVQDVENYDPILNPVLNRELRKTGGRVLITLGDQDIDLSPSFTIFLSTRDPTVEFPPDICSRVTFVNFTVTRSSLQTQCLNQVLKAERPDIDQKRSDLLKLQGEFQLRLRHLEKNLLSCLNEAKGRILDDDNVINNLEVLKTEAAEVGRKVDETDQVMADIENTSKQYLPLSSACSHIYFTIEGLHQLHFLYQFSLKFFLDIYQKVLTKDKRLEETKDSAERLSIITNDLYSTCYERVARGMLHEDRLVFALLLAKIHLKASGEQALDNEFKILLRGGEKNAGEQVSIIQGLTEEQTVKATRLASCLPVFKELPGKCSNSAIATWLGGSNPELVDIPTCLQMWEEDKVSKCQVAMYKVLLIQALRPDRLPAASLQFVATCLGQDFVKVAEREPDMADVIENQVESGTPILMCSVPGYDASSRVDDLAAELNKPVTSIAIGSAEGFNEADKAINTAVRSGKWVLLKNVHLAPSWLVTLEKKLHTITAHAGFRLFLTCEINPKIPVNLLRAGRIFTYEPPPGIRANLLRTFATISAARMMKAPHERCRMYFLLAWFHAIVQERLRYSPLGWSKTYEFGESDLRVACDTMDTWIEATAMNRTNLPPEKVPWKAIRTLLSDCIYGGKIDNEFDQRLLSSFLEKLFVPASFEGDFSLVESATAGGHTQPIKMPEGIRRDQFLAWVEALTDQNSPDWLGLPNNAEKVLLASSAHDLVINLLKMQQLDEDEELAYSDGEVKGEAQAGRPAWMRTMEANTSGWLRLLPPSITPLKRTVENIKDPLYRFFEREVNFGLKLLQAVRLDPEDVAAIIQSGKKQTNHHRALIQQLNKGIIPKSWLRYKVPTSCSVAAWVTDFAQRVKQLTKVSSAVQGNSAAALKTVTVWMGGLFNPEAFITATRQCVAQANSRSLEELSLDVTVADEADQPSFDDCSFAVEGLKLSGAVCRGNQLARSSEISTNLHLTRLRWVRNTEANSNNLIELPVYLDSSRANFLFKVNLPLAEGQKKTDFHERGVAIIASTALN